MDTDGLDALAGRVRRLERECRLWRRGGAVAILGVVAVVGAGAAMRAPEELKVERLIIQDKTNGRRGISLSVQEGIPALTLFNEAGEKVSLAISDDGSAMLSFVDAGKPRLAMGLSRTGAPVLNLNDEKQRRRISLGIFTKVGPMISVLDEKNQATFKAP